MSYIKQKTIEHYERMIAWAKTQDPNQFVSRTKMYDSIKENWFSSSCPHCIKYDVQCKNCNLSDFNFPKYCCNKLWKIMNESLIWKLWIENAGKVLEYIKENG